MSETQEVPQSPEWRLQLQADQFISEPYFDELLHSVVTICLRAPGRFEKVYQQMADERNLEPNSDGKMLCQLGLRGLRAAFEQKELPQEFRQTTNSDIKSDFPIRYPEHFSSELNRDVQTKIEAFGKAILDEAFLCLGEDALDKVEQFKDSIDVDEQTDIIRWLVKRIYHLQNDASWGETETAKEHQFFYHPLRLAPAMIGQFPDIELTPTCLGVSLLAAAFFEKADCDYLHAGVATSYMQNVQHGYIGLLGMAMETSKEMKIPIPDYILQNIRQACMDTLSDLEVNNGNHAALMVRLPVSGNWLQIDPNFRGNTGVAGEMNEHFDRVLHDLQLTRTMAPGMELMTVNPYMRHARFCSVLLAGNLQQGRQAKASEIDAFLRTCDEGVTMTDLRDRFVNPLFEAPRDDKTYRGIERLVRDLELTDNTKALPAALDHVMRTHVFADAKDGDISRCLRRCKTDEAYRVRRVQDLLLAPLWTSVKFGELAADFRFQLHDKLELGLPRYRIGAAVLHDFALNLQSQLPASFWETYWPSNIPLVDHVADAKRSFAQKAIINNNIGGLLVTQLRYNSDSGIVSSFLKQDGGDTHEDQEAETPRVAGGCRRR